MKKELIFYLFLLIFVKIKAGYEIIVQEGEELHRYNNDDYLRLYKIPNSMMQFKATGGETNNHPLSNAFDENFDTYWESIEHKTDTFSNAIEITFSKTITFDRVIFKAPTTKGFPSFFNFYCKLRKPDGTLSEKDSDFLLIDTTAVDSVTNRIAYYLYDPATCDQIKLEWDMVDDREDKFPKATASEIMVLIPQNNALDKLLNLYSEKDYTQLTLNDEYKNINDLELELQDYIYTYDHIKEIIDRAKKIAKGELKYNKRREFTTNQKAQGKMNVLHQHGNIREYSNKILGMRYGSTNLQCTGIYGYAGDNIIIYVQSEDASPLPSIYFSQYMGFFFRSQLYKLKKGKNVLKIPKLDTTGITVMAKPGGPIYFENIYTPSEQSQNIKIYIDNGILFPLFKKNDDETEFKSILKQYILDYNKNIDSYYNIMELSSDRVTITLNATEADLQYNINKESPQKNLENWDNLMIFLYSFVGIQFEKNQPYYSPENEYINIHIRYSTPLAGAYAYSYYDYIGLFDPSSFTFPLITHKINHRAFVHEIGHMLDLDCMEIPEKTNVVLEEYSTNTVYKGTYNRMKYMVLIYEDIAPDNIDNLSRHCQGLTECKGFFIDVGKYYHAHYMWWDIEAFNPGYWGKLYNMYRYNYTLIEKMNKNEGMVYFSSLIVGIDLGYYFERFGLSMDEVTVFNNTKFTDYYKNAMEKEIKEGKIKKNIIKKYWYADFEQYSYFLNNGKGCYKNSNNYVIKIEEFKKVDDEKLNIILPTINCEGHLGFEIVENDVVIGYTVENSFIDKKTYPKNYKRKYKIVAYDRLLDYKESVITYYEENN